MAALLFWPIHLRKWRCLQRLIYVYIANSWVHFHIIVVSAGLALDAILKKVRYPTHRIISRGSSPVDMHTLAHDQNATPLFGALRCFLRARASKDLAPVLSKHLCHVSCTYVNLTSHTTHIVITIVLAVDENITIVSTEGKYGHVATQVHLVW